jgi:hypothetical protein
MTSPERAPFHAAGGLIEGDDRWSPPAHPSCRVDGGRSEADDSSDPPSKASFRRVTAGERMTNAEGGYPASEMPVSAVLRRPLPPPFLVWEVSDAVEIRGDLVIGRRVTRESVVATWSCFDASEKMMTDRTAFLLACRERTIHTPLTAETAGLFLCISLSLFRLSPWLSRTATTDSVPAFSPTPTTTMRGLAFGQRHVEFDLRRQDQTRRHYHSVVH